MSYRVPPPPMDPSTEANILADQGHDDLHAFLAELDDLEEAAIPKRKESREPQRDAARPPSSDIPRGRYH